MTQQGTVHEIDRIVRAQPHRTALTDARTTLTYSELAHRVSAATRRLAELGVERGDIAGICMAHRIDLVVTLLSIWRSGCAFVPLDPTYPEERLSYMVADSGSAIVVGDRKLGSLPATVAQVHVDELLAPPGVASPAPVDVPPDGLAYVMYTSGSTGTPKGVAIEHHNVTAFFRAMQESLGAKEDAVWLAATSISFDPSLLELIFPLTHGAHVQIHGPGSQLSPRGAGPHATHVQGTPTKLRMMLAFESGRQILRRAEHILIGGETLRPALVADLRQVSDAILYNLYGPTEATIWATLAPVPHPPSSDESIPIGRALPGMDVDVIGPDSRVLPPGEIGELCVSGAQVARGYWNRPELTDERFLLDRGRRSYRTGDLGYRTTDGVIHFCGRADSQVKVAGHRVELDEIELAIESVPGVAQAAVVHIPSGTGEQEELVGFVAHHHMCDVEELPQTVHSHLVQHLPGYMVPSHIIPMPALPTNGAGKVDKKRLAHQCSTPPHMRTAASPTATVAQAWARVLGSPVEDANTNFLHAGGTSLALLALARDLNQIADAPISLDDLLREPTIHGMARVLDRRPSTAEPTPVGTPSPGAVDELTATQRCYVWACMPNIVTSNCNVSARVPLDGADDSTVRTAVARVLDAFDSLRYRFTTDPTGILTPVPIAIDVESVLRFADQTGDDPVTAAMAMPFDPRAEPLIRVYRNPRAKTDELVVITHHLVADGRSADILGRWLRTALQRPISPATESRTCDSFAAYARWEKHWRTSDQYRLALRYWNSYFADVTAPTHVGPDRVLTSPTGPGAARLLRLPPDLTARLRSLARRNGHSLTSIALTGWARTVSAELRLDSPIILVPRHGRHAPQFLDAVGMYAALAAIRIHTPHRPCDLNDIHQIAHQFTNATSKRPYWLNDLDIAQLSGGRRDRFPVSSVMFNEGTMNELSPTDLSAPDGAHRPLGRDVRFDVQAILRTSTTALTLDVAYRSDLLAGDVVDVVCERLISELQQLATST